MESTSTITRTADRRGSSWYMSHDVIMGGAADYRLPPRDLYSGGIARILERVTTHRHPEIVILIEWSVARMLGFITDPTTTGSEQRITRSAASVGYRHGRLDREWVTFYPDATIPAATAPEHRPRVHIGQMHLIRSADRRTRIGAPTEGNWPFSATWPYDSLAALDRWYELAGIAWQAGPPVMGVELLHRTLGSYRIPGTKGLRNPAKKAPTPEPLRDATEPLWTPQSWRPTSTTISRTIGVRAGEEYWEHGYDRRTAGIAAAGKAKCSPTPLQRHWGAPYSPKLAGWWLIDVPPWNWPGVPHPCGPYVQPGDRRWCQTATLDLLAELAAQNAVDMPDPIDSWTGPARPLLADWSATLARIVTAPVDDRYTEIEQAMCGHAAKEVGNHGLGLISSGSATIDRADWYWSSMATKRANGFRRIWNIHLREGRYPSAIDDDKIYYPSTIGDIVKAAPAGLGLADEKPVYRPENSIPRKGREAL